MRRWVPMLGALAALVAAVPASAEVVWLCKPGLEPDPCAGSLETTVFDSAGASRVETPVAKPSREVDCFYVYPTVSQQGSSNANKDKDPEVVAIAQYQAARFSSICPVYAPMYRQQTLLALAQGGSPEALQLAYSDVVEAWNEYLAKDNGGRGVVLIGHSQGTRMLRQLVRKEIDPRPEVRRRLVSAVLVGGNVVVRRDGRPGGDFENVTPCRSAGQVGCVMALSTFNEPPPSNSRYGRVAEDTSGFGLPSGPEYEVLCTNPASLGANARAPLSTYLRSEPFPGVLGLLLTEMYGGPPPSADTPWIQPQDHYTAQCQTLDGANVLMLEPIAGARKLNPAPDPSWGLHLADGNIALGNFVEVVAGQIAAYKPAAAAAAKPRLRLRVRCVGGRIRARVVGRDRGRVRSVRISRARSHRSARRIRAIVRMNDGRRIVLRRRAPRC